MLLYGGPFSLSRALIAGIFAPNSDEGTDVTFVLMAEFIYDG